MRTVRKQGLTLIELTVVLLIVSILSAISISVYSTFTQRARIARAAAEINELSLSITRYQTDLGVFPPSRSFNSLNGPSVFIPYTNFGLIPGNGWLMYSLLRSIGGTPTLPSNPLWRGPYMDVRQDQLLDFATGAAITSNTLPSNVCLSDPFGKPYSYVNSNDYTAAAPLGATLSGPPFFGFFNPTTFQIYSAGPDGRTGTSPNAGNQLPPNGDDIRNF